MRLNAYLQSWAQSAELLKSTDLANMMAVGKQYGVTLDAMAISREIQDSMPIFYHNSLMVTDDSSIPQDT